MISVGDNDFFRNFRLDPNPIEDLKSNSNFINNLGLTKKNIDLFSKFSIPALQKCEIITKTFKFPMARSTFDKTAYKNKIEGEFTDVEIVYTNINRGRLSDKFEMLTNNFPFCFISN